MSYFDSTFALALHFCFASLLTFITILYGLIVLGLVGTVARGSTLRITTPAEEY